MSRWRKGAEGWREGSREGSEKRDVEILYIQVRKATGEQQGYLQGGWALNRWWRWMKVS